MSGPVYLLLVLRLCFSSLALNTLRRQGRSPKEVQGGPLGKDLMPLPSSPLPPGTSPKQAREREQSYFPLPSSPVPKKSPKEVKEGPPRVSRKRARAVKLA